MRTAKLTTEPLTCPSCITKIEKTLSRVEGVADVRVLFSSNKVRVSYDDGAVTAEDLARRVSDLGYPVLTTAVS